MNNLAITLVITGAILFVIGIIVFEQNRKRIYCVRTVRYLVRESDDMTLYARYDNGHERYVSTGKILTEIEIEKEITK